MAERRSERAEAWCGVAVGRDESAVDREKGADGRSDVAERCRCVAACLVA
jgi:hypothetical protein